MRPRCALPARRFLLLLLLLRARATAYLYHEHVVNGLFGDFTALFTKRLAGGASCCFRDRPMLANGRKFEIWSSCFFFSATTTAFLSLVRGYSTSPPR